MAESKLLAELVALPATEVTPTDSIVILSASGRDALVSALRRAERVEMHARRLVDHIDDLDACLEERGRPSAPCHGTPMGQVLTGRDVLRATLGPKP